jgi:uncharacterized protein YhbP (UPF0306 family)
MIPEPATVENGWVNTIDHQNPTILAQAQQILDQNRYLTLSTCWQQQPWVSPLLFTYDPQGCFYWSSALAARHSQNLLHNPQAAIVLFNSNPPPSAVAGLYFSGVASELPGEQVELVATYFDDRAPLAQPRDRSHYQAPSLRRFYQFQPHSAWITGQRLAVDLVDQPNQLLIDTKIQLDLAQLFPHFV